MNFRLYRTLLGPFCLFVTLASCSPSAPTPQAGGGIGGTGSVATVASGPVTKFGSVYISGVEYDNTGTIYCIDDEPCSRANSLKLGMVVVVNGKVSEEYSTNRPLTRTADTITYEESVEGIVQSVASDGSSLVVLGQVVSVDQNTIIDPGVPGQSVLALRPGVDLVEISGFVIGDGRILATLIMKQSGTPHFEVQGTIKNYDAAKKEFAIGALIVDYSGADVVDLPTSQTWDGVVVHIRGNQWNGGGPGPFGARLAATKITKLTLGVEDSADAEVEGFILRTDAPGDFYINNLHVQATAATQFEGGILSDLTVGTHVEIQGRLANGILQAGQISFEGNIELESNVVSIDRGAKTLTLAGLSGLVLRTDDKTVIDGEGNLRRVEDVAVGDHLKVHGLFLGGGLLATELERSGPSTSVTLQGPIQSVTAPLLVIAGATIDTSDIPDSGFIGNYGSIGRTAFFQELNTGQTVSVRGAWTGSSVRWTSIGLDD
jgi:hypothetical protein